jgi:peptidoglycan/xylan/chitin deacetylase (PgdA/CDA1 family)
VLATPIGFETFQKDPVNALLQGGMRIENRELLYDPKFGEKKIYADENDVRFLHANGVLIGSHASSHFVLSQCPLDEVQRLARENRLFLEGLLNTRIEHFSIPFGKKEHYNEQVLDCLQKEYKYIYNSNPDMVPLPGEFNPRCIPQISFANAGLPEAIFYLNRTFVTRVDI